MTIELMDGRTGEAHISSEDWATFNAATYGVTEGVFDWGDGFKLAMSTSNKGTLGAGAGLVDGKRVWVKTPESVTIESGGQGVKRHDVVGIQYETHSTNLERAVVKVVKGTPAASPADPDLPSKFLPLWRVPLDGLNVGAPVALFDKLPTAAGLRDSVSRKLDADKLTFSNSAKAFSVNSWGTGIQLDVNDDGGSYQSVVFDDNGIGYFVNNQRKWQIRP